jgi:receptor expression-enhancing protein 1/2/3/4
MAIAEVRVKAYRFFQERARSIWAAVVNALTSGTVQDANAAGAGQIGMGDQASSNPAGGPTQLLSSLWTAYGPGIIAGGTALLRQTAAATLPTGTAPGTNNTADANGRSNVLNTPPGSTFFHSSADLIAERRRQLEAELASLPPHPSTSFPIPPANNSPVRPGLTPSSSSSSVRERLNSGRFEEIKGGDVEGYKVETEPLIGGFVPGDSNRPKSAGWFGGWSSGSSGSKERGSYERVKNE